VAVRAEASKRVQDAIVAATVQIVAREGVAAVTHRRLAAEAGVSLSSTTWHFATKTDILTAALRWTAAREVAHIGEIAARLGGAELDLEAWSGALAEWLIEQVTSERESAVALYRLQIELLGAHELHREWGRGLREVAQGVLERSDTAAVDIRLVIAALDGLRLSVILSGEEDVEWLREAVNRQLRSLLG